MSGHRQGSRAPPDVCDRDVRCCRGHDGGALRGARWSSTDLSTLTVRGMVRDGRDKGRDDVSDGAAEGVKDMNKHRDGVEKFLAVVTTIYY